MSLDTGPNILEIDRIVIYILAVIDLS